MAFARCSLLEQQLLDALHLLARVEEDDALVRLQQVVQVLLEAMLPEWAQGGAYLPVDKKNNHGDTPLHMAAAKGKLGAFHVRKRVSSGTILLIRFFIWPRPGKKDKGKPDLYLHGRVSSLTRDCSPLGAEMS